MEKKLVRLRIRPSRNGRSFTYVLDYVDANGNRQRKSLGPMEPRQAERERTRVERELKMGVIAPESMELSEFVADSLSKTGDQIRESTRQGYAATMKEFISVIGDKDYQKATLQNGEYYRQYCLDQGNSPATVTKKFKEIKAIFQLAVKRQQLEGNPFAYITKPKCPEPEIHTYPPHATCRTLGLALPCNQNEHDDFIRHGLGRSATRCSVSRLLCMRQELMCLCLGPMRHLGVRIGASPCRRGILLD